MSNLKIVGISVPCALVLGLGTILFFDHVSPSKVKESRQTRMQILKKEQDERIAKRQKGIEKARKAEEARAERERIRLEKQREYENSDEYKAEKLYKDGMSLYEKYSIVSAYGRFKSASNLGHAEAANMLGNIWYNQELPHDHLIGIRRYRDAVEKFGIIPTGSGAYSGAIMDRLNSGRYDIDIAKGWWKIAVRRGSSAAKENIDRIVRNR